MPQTPWQNKVIAFATSYNQLQLENPNWNFNKISEKLNSSPASTCKILNVFKHLNDPRISNSTTFNQAYFKLRSIQEDQKIKTKIEITEVSTQMFNPGEN